MSPFLASIVAFYDYALQPVSALAWVGVPITPLDIAAAFRLALILRQLRGLFRQHHLAKMSTSSQVKNAPVEPLEHRSRVRDFTATLVMVFGGEAVVGALYIRLHLSCADSGLIMSPSIAPWLGLQPTFVLSGGYPLLYLGASALVDSLPTVPELSLFTELPFSVLDGLTRALLLCDFVPRMITTHTSLAVSTSPYTLLLTAFVRTRLNMGLRITDQR
jgi:hypothetical protein